MKNLIVLALIGLFISCSITRRNPNLIDKSETNSMYRIKNIKNEKSFYIIYAMRNDSTFKIISNISSANNFGCENIKVGKSYNLDLKVIFPSDSLLGIPISPNLGIKGVSINNNKIITIEKKCHSKIYAALNLIGLWVKE